MLDDVDSLNLFDYGSIEIFGFSSFYDENQNLVFFLNLYLFVLLFLILRLMIEV